MEWNVAKAIVHERDGSHCRDCGEFCQPGESDIHHLIPRYFGGRDEPSNLIKLCDGCHAARHPNLQVSLSGRTLRRWALRLARLIRPTEVPPGTEYLEDVLRTVLRFPKYREGQLDPILEALSGRSSLTILPTGGGKTVCFWIPALLNSGVSFVITPLKALMTDQVVHLQKLKIPATFLNSDLGEQEKKLRMHGLSQQGFKLLYLAPERFDLKSVRNNQHIAALCALKPSLLIVDEAHCVDLWGEDFRPAYSKLADVRQRLGNPPVMAFTATAGIDMQRRILQSLGIEDARVFVQDIDRPNIMFLRKFVSNDDERIEQIVQILGDRRLDGRKLIFVPTVKIGRMLQDRLRKLNISLEFYYGRADRLIRDNILGRFSGRIEPAIDCVICTNAFGMGMDLPDVRAVIHWQHPSSIEDLAQEVGRAGRDGQPSLALMLVGPRDKGLPMFMIEKSAKGDIENQKEADRVRWKLEQVQLTNRLVCAKGSCYRRNMMDHFNSRNAERKSLVFLFLRWLLTSRRRLHTGFGCCDYCHPKVSCVFR